MKDLLIGLSLGLAVVISIMVFASYVTRKPERGSTVSVEPLGKIIDAEIPQLSFNKEVRMIIKCESAVVVIHGTPSVVLGEEADIRILEDGSKWFTYTGSSRMWRCY